MTKHYITPEEHARLQRRRGRQALGLLITILVLVGFVTVLRASVGLVANLFDDTAQKQEYEDKLEGLVLFDPMPFDGIENIDDLTLREAAVWGCIYNIQETQGGFDNYNTDPDTEQLLLPSVEVDAYLRAASATRSRSPVRWAITAPWSPGCSSAAASCTSPWAIFPPPAPMTASSTSPRTRPPSIWTICSSARAAAGISPV